MIVRISKKLILILFLTTTYSISEAAGWIDSASSTTINGWACDTRFPGEMVDVHVWRDDDVFLGGTNASITREMAVAYACGSGHSLHGFSVPLITNDTLNDGKKHQVHVYLIDNWRDGYVQELDKDGVQNPSFAAH